MRDKKTIRLVNIILASLYIVIWLLVSFTFNMYHIYSHMADYSFLLIFTELLKLTSFLVIPLAVFLNHKTSINIAKYLLPIIAVLSMFVLKEYTSIVKTLENTRNTNGLDLVTIEIYDSINLFMPQWLITGLFILENLVIITIGVNYLLTDENKVEDLKSLKWFPIYILVCLPLNIFTELVELFPDSVITAMTFDNFTIWHFLMFAILIGATLLTYFVLRKLSYEKQVFYLRAMAIILFIHFFSKNSMLIGDGYNVYNTVFAAIPFFICDIGKFIALLAVFTKKKKFYDIAYFVHAVGALTVFFYFGREGTHNYGTILNYSFLYFTITHAILFILCVMPVMLKHTTFSIKDALTPSIYYGIVILIATFTSVAITNYSGTLTTASGEYLTELLYPNYAFTQINPLPITLPSIMVVTIGICEVDFLYLICLYIVYLCLFFLFFVAQLLVKKLVKIYNEKKALKET